MIKVTDGLSHDCMILGHLNEIFNLKESITHDQLKYEKVLTQLERSKEETNLVQADQVLGYQQCGFN